MGASICTECGLCCDGSLFGYVELEPAEEERVRRVLPLVTRDGGARAVVQPCAAHRGDRCVVYDDRPSSCAAYRCEVLRRVEAGELSREEALARIAEAKRLVIAAGPVTPDAESLERRKEHRAALLDAVVLDAYLRRHFRACEDGVTSSS